MINNESELFLIVHKVRGLRAFDVAEKFLCPLCDGVGCLECQALGFWFILPTSGHRARAFAHVRLRDYPVGWKDSVPDCPENWPDHYTINEKVKLSKINELDLEELGL